MATDDRKYKFDWDIIGGDASAHRPSLGSSTTLEMYRLFQFTLRDELEQEYGTEEADRIFRRAGILAGSAFYERYCRSVKDGADLAKTVQDRFRELGVGIVRFEISDFEKGIFQLTVDEDLDCSGLPDTSDHICVYDEGFIKGILDSHTGKKFRVREVDCWCSGARTCRFRAEA